MTKAIEPDLILSIPMKKRGNVERYDQLQNFIMGEKYRDVYSKSFNIKLDLNEALGGRMGIVIYKKQGKNGNNEIFAEGVSELLKMIYS